MAHLSEIYSIVRVSFIGTDILEVNSLLSVHLGNYTETFVSHKTTLQTLHFTLLAEI